MSSMILEIVGDPQADAMYICLSKQPVAYSEEFTDNIVGDFTEDGTLVGIDVQQVSLLQRTDPDEAADSGELWGSFGAQVTLAASAR